MDVYYNILIDYWKAGKVNEALKYFNEWKKAGLLSQEEVEELKQKLPEVDELLIQAIDEEPEVTYIFYRLLKEKNGWDDRKLCENLNISEKDAEKIKLRLPISKKIRYKIVIEYFNSVRE